MKNTKKRGFTIVELVIVIAVIAILASVLIPTFSGVVTKAKKSVALQDARNAWTAYLVDHYDAIPTGKICIKSGDFYYEVVDGQFTGKACENEESHNCYTIDAKGTLVAPPQTNPATHTYTAPAAGGGEGAGGGNNQGGGQG